MVVAALPPPPEPEEEDWERRESRPPSLLSLLLFSPPSDFQRHWLYPSYPAPPPSQKETDRTEATDPWTDISSNLISNQLTSIESGRGIENLLGEAPGASASLPCSTVCAATPRLTGLPEWPVIVIVV